MALKLPQSRRYLFSTLREEAHQKRHEQLYPQGKHFPSWKGDANSRPPDQTIARGSLPDFFLRDPQSPHRSSWTASSLQTETLLAAANHQQQTPQATAAHAVEGPEVPRIKLEVR